MAIGANEISILVHARDEASKQLGGISKSVGTLAKAAIGLAAAFASIKSIEGTIKATQELGMSVNKLSRETGLTVEASSQLLFAFKHVGLDAADSSKSIGIFAKKLKGVSDEETGVITGGKSTAAVLADIGIQALDASGGIRPLSELLPAVADQFKTMPNGLEKTGLAMQLFGRSGKDMIPLLNQGSQGLKELAAEADKLGVTLTAANVGAIKQFTYAQRDMQEAITGVKMQIGMALMPALTRLMEGFISIQPTMREFVSTLISGFQKAVGACEPVTKVIGDLFGLLGRKDLIAIFAALSAAIVVGFLAIAASAVVAFIAENAALLGIPIAVAAEVAAITLLVRHWDAVWGAMQKAPAAILNWLKDNWGKVLIAIITGPIGVLVMNWSRIWNVMPGPVQAAMNAIAGIFAAAINGILINLNILIGGLNRVIDGLNAVRGAALGIGGILLSKLFGAGGAIPTIPEITARVNFELQASVKPIVEGVEGLKLAAKNFKKQADETIPSVDELGLDLGDLGGAAGGAAEKVAEVVDVLADGIFSLAEATKKGVPAWAAARFEMEATAKTLADEVAEKAWRAQVELSKLALSLGDAGVSKAAFDFAVLAGILSGELKDTGTALENFIQDGVISYKEAIELGLNPVQQAAIELARERFTAEQAAAEATNRANVELIKLAQAMGEKGVTAATVAFWAAAKMANEGTLTLTAALNLGLLPAQAALIQGYVNEVTAKQALKDAIYAVMVDMATFTLQLAGLSGPAADSVRELNNLGIQLGNTGLGRQALDFELAMQEVNRSFGEGKRAAGEVAYAIGTELVNALQGAIGQLLGRGTVETAQLQLNIDVLQEQLTHLADLHGAEADAIQAQIDGYQRQLDALNADHKIMQDRATLADQTLPTERELKDMVKEITDNIRIESGRVKDLIGQVELQTAATTAAKDQTKTFGDVAKGATDYLGFFTRGLGDSAGAVMTMNYDMVSAGRHVIDVFNSIQAPSGYQMGTSFVPSTGVYTLHRGEAVLTAAEAAQHGRGEGSSGGNYYNYGRYQVVLPNVRDHSDFLREQGRILRGL
ncbi:MAG: hypothetical protein MUP14_07845 [Dehalococcoidia bacterium]|nr:hypothetical protein [Dehalococcoidia bacterium]